MENNKEVIMNNKNLIKRTIVLNKELADYLEQLVQYEYATTINKNSKHAKFMNKLLKVLKAANKEILCENCGKNFYQYRSDKKYCCRNCSKNAWRKRNLDKVNEYTKRYQFLKRQELKELK